MGLDEYTDLLALEPRPDGHFYAIGNGPFSKIPLDPYVRGQPFCLAPFTADIFSDFTIIEGARGAMHHSIMPKREDFNAYSLCSGPTLNGIETMLINLLFVPESQLAQASKP